MWFNLHGGGFFALACTQFIFVNITLVVINSACLYCTQPHSKHFVRIKQTYSCQNTAYSVRQKEKGSEGTTRCKHTSRDSVF